jgi:hypothetical protein
MQHEELWKVEIGCLRNPVKREDAGPPHYAVPGMYYEKVYSNIV